MPLEVPGRAAPGAPFTSPAPVPASPPPDDAAAAPRAFAAPAIALVVALLAFLPIADWIPGGFADAGYALRVSEWVSGSAIALGGGLVLALLARRGFPVGDALASAWQRAALAWERRPFVLSLVVALVALATYTVIALAVFDGRPLLIDEIAQALQARTFLTGRLAAPVGQPPEFFSTLHMVELNGRVFSQFPPGGPLMLALGDAVGAMWLVGPVFGAMSVLLWSAILRRVEPRPHVALAALVLFALAPFTAFMAGSHMNHVTTLTWTLAGVLGLVRLLDTSERRLGSALLCGAGFGIAATIRPVDAFAFALPAGTWLFVRMLRDRERRGARLAELVVAGAAIVVPLALMGWFNLRTTGHPLVSGYELLWGKGHNLGFHRNPWGHPHTPARGLELVNLYFIRLQQYLFETPLPSLVPALGALLLARRLRALDRYLLVAAGLVVGLYFAYWHDGFYLGPRFVYALAPIATLWTARFLPALRERLRAGQAGDLAYGTAAGALAVAVIVMLLASLPLRVRQYAASFAIQRWDPDRNARAAGIDRGVVLARESWEAQLVIRMRALGATQPEAERFYRSIDVCRLDGALAKLEATPAAARPAITSALVPLLLADSAHVQLRELSAGAFVRVRPGTWYGPECMARAAETTAGVLPLAPFLLARNPRMIYARDLHARDTLLLQRHPGEPVYLLRPSSPEPNALPVFVPLSRDSIFRAARQSR